MFAFADVGTGLFVYDPKNTVPPIPLSALSDTVPTVEASAYLVADIDTSDVCLEHNATSTLPIGAVTKLMTALVANETISFEKKITVTEGMLIQPDDTTKTNFKKVLIGRLLYPMLMSSNTHIAEVLASTYGVTPFFRWMNRSAHAFDMQSTTFADVNGVSTQTQSMADDIFQLTTYIVHKKSFVFDIIQTLHTTVFASDGTKFNISYTNELQSSDQVASSSTLESFESTVSILPITHYPNRRVVLIILHSPHFLRDQHALLQWINNTHVTLSDVSTSTANTACTLHACIAFSVS